MIDFARSLLPHRSRPHQPAPAARSAVRAANGIPFARQQLNTVDTSTMLMEDLAMVGLKKCIILVFLLLTVAAPIPAQKPYVPGDLVAYDWLRQNLVGITPGGVSSRFTAAFRSPSRLLLLLRTTAA